MKIAGFVFSKKFVFILIIGALCIAGTSFAWVNTTWHDPSVWIADEESITAKMVGENFEYLLSLFSEQCTTHNEGKVRYVDEDLEYCTQGTWGVLQN